MFMNVYHGKDVIDIQLEEKGDTCFFFQKSEIYLTWLRYKFLQFIFQFPWFPHQYSRSVVEFEDRDRMLHLTRFKPTTSESIDHCTNTVEYDFTHDVTVL